MFCLVLIIPMFSLPSYPWSYITAGLPPTVDLQGPRWLRLEGLFSIRAHGPLSFIPCLLLPVHLSDTLISDVVMWCSLFLLGYVFFDLLDSSLACEQFSVLSSLPRILSVLCNPPNSG